MVLPLLVTVTLSALYERFSSRPFVPALPCVGLLAGIAGSAVDTLIGASVQARFVCGSCGADVEDPLHCGAPTQPSSGWRWMDNDVVNACANATGMVTGLAIFAIWAW